MVRRNALFVLTFTN